MGSNLESHLNKSIFERGKTEEEKQNDNAGVNGTQKGKTVNRMVTVEVSHWMDIWIMENLEQILQVTHVLCV